MSMEGLKNFPCLTTALALLKQCIFFRSKTLVGFQLMDSWGSFYPSPQNTNFDSFKFFLHPNPNILHPQQFFCWPLSKFVSPPNLLFDSPSLGKIKNALKFQMNLSKAYRLWFGGRADLPPSQKKTLIPIFLEITPFLHILIFIVWPLRSFYKKQEQPICFHLSLACLFHMKSLISISFLFTKKEL